MCHCCADSEYTLNSFVQQTKKRDSSRGLRTHLRHTVVAAEMAFNLTQGGQLFLATIVMSMVCFTQGRI